MFHDRVRMISLHDITIAVERQDYQRDLTLFERSISYLGFGPLEMVIAEEAFC